MDRFDNFYVTIAQEAGGIQGLFESMFNFLYRKTDFFYECEPGDKMGFPPGVNIKIIYELFQKYQQEHYKKYPQKNLEDYQKKLKNYKENLEKETQPTENQQSKQNQTQTNQQIKEENKKQKQEIKEQIPVVNRFEQQEKETQLKEKKVENINTYNGGKTEKYSWSQSVNDVVVGIKLPQFTKPKEINVDFKSTSFSVKLKGEEYLSGKLFDKIKVDDSFWNIEDGCLLVLNLEKGTENIWKTVLQGDSEIDTTKVDNSKNIHEFDPETQGALRKIMHEQDRKMKGLPTTEEEKQMEFIKKAWDSEGSPFKGTPYDPSKLNFNQNQNQNM